MDYLPNFYRPDMVGQNYQPDIATAILAGQQTGLPASQDDTRNILLLLIDMQVDFIHEDGSLSVPGAVADTRRTVEWLYRNTDRVTAIAASLDSHVPLQIFYPTWWVNEAGQHPEPFTTITSAAVDSGEWRPLFEPRWSINYVHMLETESRKELMIWPYHTMIGTPGHMLTPALYEAIAYHSGARQSQPTFLFKGSIAKSEYYSLLEPEVKVSDHSQGDLNADFLDMLTDYDAVYVAGQAKSHCVLETLRSVMHYLKDRPGEIEKWHVLTDCMSSVAHPEIDFDAMADKAFGSYAARGLRLVTSADPVG